MPEKNIIIARIGIEGADPNGLCHDLAEEIGAIELVNGIEKVYGGFNNVFEQGDIAAARGESLLAASDLLMAGKDVVLNANLYTTELQDEVREIARRRDALVLFLDIHTPMHLIVARLDNRSAEFPLAASFNAPKDHPETDEEMVQRLRQQALARLVITERPKPPYDESVLPIRGVELASSLEITTWHIDRKLRKQAPSTT